MNSETGKNLINHLLSSALSDLKLTSHLDSLDIKVPNSEFGDYSSNAALVLAKKVKQNPKVVAAKIIEEIAKNESFKDLVTMKEQGGFINFTFTPKYLTENLNKILEQGDLYGCSVSGQGKTVVVEYFQNNVAKPPHVGHLRSAVIGDCLLRVLKSQGYKAVSDTHIGDWGTQFGILLFAYKEYLKSGGDKKQIEADPISELNKLYVGMSAKIESEPELRDQGKEEFAKLEKGDTENRELWQWFVRVSLADFENYRKILDILPFDHNLGESFYEDKMPAILADLKQKNLLSESEGAQVVNLEEQKLGVAVLVKSDGATTYLTRDVATIKYRVEEMKLEKMLYVVDNRQSHHFDQLFEIAKQAKYVPEAHTAEHVDFGFMSLPEGAISTRKGTTISLKNLIEEARKRAAQIIEEKNPGLENKQAVAEQVALAAIKYFDLSHNRKTEIIFTWDKALSFEGNTGPYLQYTHARINGILRKVVSSESRVESELATSNSQLATPELAVLRKLVLYPEVVAQVAKDYLPNGLCNYLFELSQEFNSFYQAVPVAQEQDLKIRDFRLQLITATAQVLRNGLYLLGIEAPEEM
ncbi:MAG: arginine--tRNA ligase [Candidatus Doudnabacteria bacterium]|nr:arginine--tRNA ligase [Candidatus Doudnabacteria bacterium]